jgi:hypothetical protein
LDIFTNSVGLADTTKQIHDYAPFITPSGLFWTMPLHPNSVQVQFNSARASMHVDGLSIPDTHDLANSLTGGKGFASMGIQIPPIAPVPATVSFDVQWFGEISRATVVNEAQNFRGDFIKTGSTIKWSSMQNGFFFDSEEPDPSHNLGATIGRERNGVFFSEKDDD